MFLKAYSIFDVKADQFNAPWFKSTHGQAVREFADLANDPQSQVHRHPEDFKLVCVGGYDDTSGTLVPNERPEGLGFATEYIKKEDKR